MPATRARTTLLRTASSRLQALITARDQRERKMRLDAAPAKVGRSPEEVLRVLDALQTDELCPCNWKPGQQTLKVA